MGRWEGGRWGDGEVGGRREKEKGRRGKPRQFSFSPSLLL